MVNKEFNLICLLIINEISYNRNQLRFNDKNIFN